MSSTTLGAEKAIIFISDAHEKFYYESKRLPFTSFSCFICEEIEEILT